MRTAMSSLALCGLGTSSGMTPTPCLRIPMNSSFCRKEPKRAASNCSLRGRRPLSTRSGHWLRPACTSGARYAAGFAGDCFGIDRRTRESVTSAEARSRTVPKAKHLLLVAGRWGMDDEDVAPIYVVASDPYRRSEGRDAGHGEHRVTGQKVLSTFRQVQLECPAGSTRT